MTRKKAYLTMIVVVLATVLVFANTMSIEARLSPPDDPPDPTAVEGYVTDGSIPSKIAGVTVQLFPYGQTQGALKTVYTNANGFYRIEYTISEFSKTFSLKFSKSGYSTKWVSVTLYRFETVRKDATLYPRGLRIDSVSILTDPIIKGEPFYVRTTVRYAAYDNDPNIGPIYLNYGFGTSTYDQLTDLYISPGYGLDTGIFLEPNDVINIDSMIPVFGYDGTRRFAFNSGDWTLDTVRAKASEYIAEWQDTISFTVDYPSDRNPVFVAHLMEPSFEAFLQAYEEELDPPSSAGFFDYMETKNFKIDGSYYYDVLLDLWLYSGGRDTSLYEEFKIDFISLVLPWYPTVSNDLWTLSEDLYYDAGPILGLEHYITPKWCGSHIGTSPWNNGFDMLFGHSGQINYNTGNGSLPTTPAGIAFINAGYALVMAYSSLFGSPVPRIGFPGDIYLCTLHEILHLYRMDADHVNSAPPSQCYYIMTEGYKCYIMHPDTDNKVTNNKNLYNGA
ncbi:MAG: carboxypeptidase-like regulatory domain-containing protein [Candidatus Hermodarchaeota archaeon]